MRFNAVFNILLGCCSDNWKILINLADFGWWQAFLSWMGCSIARRTLLNMEIQYIFLNDPTQIFLAEFYILFIVLIKATIE